MIDIDERLKSLADSLELPPTTPADDLARGRARRRHRHLGVLGAAATTVVVIGVSAALLSGGAGRRTASPDFAGVSSPSAGHDDARTSLRESELARRLSQEAAAAAVRAEQDRQRMKVLARATRGSLIKAALNGYRDVLREDLDPAGSRIQSGPVTNQQTSTDAQGTLDGLGTKLTWSGGGMLEVAVGRSLEAVQFFCDATCTTQSVAGASQALVLSSPGKISVAVFQDDGDIVALTADTSFGNNGTSTRTLGLTADQLLAAAADPRLDLPVAPSAQASGSVGTQ